MKKIYIAIGAVCLLAVASLTVWGCNSSGSSSASALSVMSASQDGAADFDMTDGNYDSMSQEDMEKYFASTGWETLLTESGNRDAEAGKWADSVIAGLSTRERIAQLFIPRLDIENNPAGLRQLQQVIGRDKMGGFLLGKGTVDGYSALINEGQRLADVPLMITLDGEWGLSMRVAGTPRFPHNIALGAGDSPELMKAYGREMARQCRLMGIQVNFAPDLDVNSNPDNPVIGFRSFGESPELVGRLGSAYSCGMAMEGVMPVGKHFPGHGDTSTDSHKTLPLVDHSKKTLKDVDMLPFEMAIRSGLPGVMVGHLKVPALDPSGTPSSLSKIITTDWLCDSLGFSGLIFTDALAMKGASRANENNCVSALLAGADVLLGSGAPSADLNAVESAVKSGKISKEEIDRKCRKVLKYKYLLGLNSIGKVDAKGLSKKLNTPELESLIKKMSQSAITLLRNDDRLLPLRNKKVAIVNIGAKPDNQFAVQCQSFDRGGVSVSVNDANISPMVKKAVADADVVVFAVYKDAAWAKNMVARLGTDKPCVGVFFVNPFKVIKFNGLDRLKGLILAYDDIPQLRTAAAEALYGKIELTGKLPVNLPGIGKVSDGMMY